MDDDGAAGGEGDAGVVPDDGAPGAAAGAAPEAAAGGAGDAQQAFGNYPRYYGYRVGQALEDPRLTVLRPEWFVGRRGLDIGTNEGLIPLTLAVKHLTASFLGIDIDHDLVHKAKVKHRRLQQAAQAAAREAAAHPAGHASLPPDRAELAAAADALRAVSFRRGNVVEMKLEAGAFDVVTCLSVTKWVHINFGDAGLMNLFRAAHTALAPGGVFVVEPQPWPSYRQAFRKQPMPLAAQQTYAGLKLRPEQFVELLVNEVGFSRVEELRPAPTHKNSFDTRPCLVCYKGAGAGANDAAAGAGPSAGPVSGGGGASASAGV